MKKKQEVRQEPFPFFDEVKEPFMCVEMIAIAPIAQELCPKAFASLKHNHRAVYSLQGTILSEIHILRLRIASLERENRKLKRALQEDLYERVERR